MLGIRAVREERQHTLFTVSSQRVKVEFLSIQWSRINLKIARVDHGAGRCFYRQRKCVDNRVCDVEELDCETAPADLLPFFDRVELRLSKQTVLFELVLDQARAEDRNIQVWKNEG